MILYLDTSAFLKLVFEEEFSTELRAATRDADLWSSTLLDVEAHRAARRLGTGVEMVTRFLEVVTLVTIADETIVQARTIGQESLRTLDALHLATAVEIGDDLEAVVTYDRRLAAAAVDASMAVVAPGQAADWWRPITGGS